MKPFYIVWNPANDRPPMVRHTYRADAIREAERLARLCPGDEFIMLRAVSRTCVEVPSITTAYEEEMPF